MKNLIDKYKEKIFNLGVGYFDLSGEIYNDRFILNLYQSEFNDGLSLNIILDLNSNKISTFGKGGFDLNVIKWSDGKYIIQDEEEYLFYNDENIELSIKKENLENGFKLVHRNRGLEEYFLNGESGILYVDKIKDIRRNKIIRKYLHEGNRIKNILNEEENTSLTEEMIYQYNELGLCSEVRVYKGDLQLKRIVLTYDQNNYISSINVYKFESGVIKLLESYQIEFCDGLYIKFIDLITNLTKQFNLIDRNTLRSVVYEHGDSVEVEGGTIIPSYASTEEEINKTKLQYYFDNHRVIDIEGYNKLHSIRRYEDNKLLLRCDAYFKDVNYLGEVIERSSPLAEDIEELEINETNKHFIDGLVNEPLMKVTRNVNDRFRFNYHLEEEKLYTGIFIGDNLKGFTYKVEFYNGNNQLIKETETYDMLHTHFALSFKVPKFTTRTDIVFKCESCNSGTSHLTFNAFVINKAICNVYTYKDNYIYKKIENEKEVTLVNPTIKNVVYVDNGINVYDTRGNLLGVYDRSGLININEYNEDNLLTKQITKYNGVNLKEVTNAYNQNKLLERINSTLSTEDTEYQYNGLELNKIKTGSDIIEYTKDNTYPKISNILFKNNETILKRHGFNYGSDYLLRNIKENEVNAYQYTYDSKKRIIKVSQSGVILEEYQYDVRFPTLLKAKISNNLAEIYQYDIFGNLIEVKRTLSGQLISTFTFIYNEDNLLTTVLLNNNIIEKYIYSYGKLVKTIINGIEESYIRNEDEEVNEVQIKDGGDITTIHYDIDKSEGNIFKVFKEILDYDENTYGTLFYGEKTISDILMNKYIKPTDLVNIKSEMWSSSYTLGMNGPTNYKYDFDFPYVEITSDVDEEPFYYLEDNPTKMFHISFKFLTSEYNTTLLSLYYYPNKQGLKVKIDNEGRLVCNNYLGVIYEANYTFEKNKWYDVLLTSDGNEIELYIDEISVGRFRYPTVEPIGPVLFELNKPNLEGETNKYAFLFINKERNFAFREYKYFKDKINEVLNQRIETSTLKNKVHYRTHLRIDNEYEFINRFNSVNQLLYKNILYYNNFVWGNAYTYDNKQRISSETTNNRTVGYLYDDKNRLSSISTGQSLFEYSYDLKGRLDYESENGNETEYTYDNKDNLTSISFRREVIKRFAYDNLNRIIAVNNRNVLYPNSTTLYPSQIPLNEGVLNLTWQGNLLVKVIKQGSTGTSQIIFTYNSDGLRRTKKVNNVVTEYTYDIDGKLIIEKSPNKTLKYYYDSNNQLISFKYNGVMYFYERDAFNNIKHILDTFGNVVASYTYKAFGQDMNVINVDSSSDIGNINPFRYKGYYYDVETQLFYCNSRYYSPELCRWISPDSIEYLDPESINGLNLYCYCYNNPISYSDPSGNLPQWSEWLIGGALVVGAIVLTIATAGVSNLLATFLGGSLLATIGSGVVVGAAVGAVSGMMINAGTQLITNGTENFSWSEFGKSAWIGAIAGGIAGGLFAGIQYGLSAGKIANSVSGLSKAQTRLNNVFKPLRNGKSLANAPFSGANIAKTVGNVATNYNSAYSAYILAKGTNAIVNVGMGTAYFLLENLTSDLIGMAF